MSNSIDVVAGADAKASEYNALRADVLNTSTGHTHDGVDSKVLPQGAIGAGQLGDASYAMEELRQKLYSPTAIQPENETTTFIKTKGYFWANTVAPIKGFIPMDLPLGANVHTIKIYYSRSGAVATLNVKFWRTDYQENATQIASIDATGTTGYGNDENSTLNEVITTGYTYCLEINIDNDSGFNDVYPTGIMVEFGVGKPLP